MASTVHVTPSAVLWDAGNRDFEDQAAFSRFERSSLCRHLLPVWKAGSVRQQSSRRYLGGSEEETSRKATELGVSNWEAIS